MIQYEIDFVFFLLRDDIIIFCVITRHFLCKDRADRYKDHHCNVVAFFIEFEIISVIESDTKQKYSRKKVK